MREETSAMTSEICCLCTRRRHSERSEFRQVSTIRVRSASPPCPAFTKSLPIESTSSTHKLSFCRISLMTEPLQVWTVHFTLGWSRGMRQRKREKKKFTFCSHHNWNSVDAFFWVGTGPKPGQEGHQVPDENGKVDPLRRYDTKTLVLTLPGDLTVFDVEWLSIWCRAYGIDFGHIRIPKNLNVPPSLKMLGVAPQVRWIRSSTFAVSQQSNVRVT